MHTETISKPGIALVCVAQFVIVLDVTIVAVALPAIRSDLGFSAAGLQWVVTAYGLTFGGFLMLLGRLADVAGRRRMLIAGFAVFGAASLACGLATTPAMLIAARTVQGLGAAAVSPAALALLTASLPPGPRRTRAVGAYTAAAAGGGALGWVLGGLIADHVGWEWVFLVNVAPCALALAAARSVLPESRDEQADRTRPDVAGALAITAGLALLVLGLTRAEQAGPPDPTALAPLTAGALLLAAFARIERRAEQPLLPPGTVTRPPLAGAVLAALLITTTSTGALFLCVLYLQDVLGLAATEAGLLFTPVNLAVIAGSTAGARLIHRTGARTAGAAGLALLGLGILALLPIPAEGSTPPYLPLAFVAIGAGLGCASVASTALGTDAVDRDRQGLASGLLNTAAQLGNALGIAVFVLLAAAVSSADDPVTGFRWSFVAAAALVAAGGIAARALQRLPCDG
jgi:EmrB/QacA subfamily drug resistance transporter